MSINQAYLFLIFTINGFVIGILFDIFRILRKSFKTKDFITYVEDVLFWISTGFILLYSIFTFSNGEIRVYMFIGVFLGCILYMTTLSSYFIKINVAIVVTIKHIVYKFISVIIVPFKILLKPIKFITINIKNVIKIQSKSINTKKIQFFSKFKKDFRKKSRNI